MAKKFDLNWAGFISSLCYNPEPLVVIPSMSNARV